MVFVPNPGFEADMAFWKSWGLAPFDKGYVAGLALTNNNYPTPFAYLLWAVTTVYSLFANPHLFAEFWNRTNLLYLTLMKLPAILADLGIAGILLWFGSTFPTAKSSGAKKEGRAWGMLLAGLYLFNPVSILDSAVWGQVDALGVFLFLCAFVSLVKHKPFLAGLLYMVALMTKLQNMIYGPLFFLLIWQMTGFTGLVRSVAGALVAFFGLNSAFLVAKDMGRVVYSLTVNYDYFPYMSLNAYNLWWIVAGAKGMQISDKILTVGIINAKTMGLILFASTYLLSTLSMLKHTLRDAVNRNGQIELIASFFTALILAASGFFLFQTESHDRYAFPLVVFLLFWMPLFVSRHLTIKERDNFWITPIFRYTIVGYILFSLIYFVNMHTALIINYPKNGIFILSFLKHPFFTTTIAYILIAGFFLFLWINRKELTWTRICLALACIGAALVGLNMPLLTRRPVSLTRFTPPIHTQQYGQLAVNMPTKAQKNDPKTWDRLSVQYMFYRKGLGTHANSTIVYDLHRRFSRFTTDIGVDTEAGPQASVLFELYGDDQLLFRSDIIRRYEYPKHVEVDVSGVAALKLVVTDAGNGNTDDHADWLNPMLYP